METSPENMSVLLQFAKFSKGFRVSDFEDFINTHIGMGNLDFFGRLAYPNQWQIRLTDPKVREELIETGRARIKNRSCWIYPLNQQEIRGFVHWLPNSVTNDQLKEQLQLYGEVLFVESGKRTVNKVKVESDPRYYGLILPYGTIKEDLPHFLKINGFLCLVVVRGREPACYHCKEVGHRRIECPKYKAKLTSYCSREPNTAPPRLRPRGKRHLKTDTKVQAETGGNEVSSTQDIVSTEREIPVTESISVSHLSALEERENVIEAQQEEATVSTEKELEESYIFLQRDSIDSSAASLSETQLKDIHEIIQQEQRITKKIFEQTLKKFEKKIALAFTKGALSTHTRDQRQSMTTEVTSKNLDQDMSNEELETRRMENYTTAESTQIEVDKKNSNANKDMKETTAPETLYDLQTISQVNVGVAETDEKIDKNLEEIPNYLQPSKSTATFSANNADVRSSELLFLEETKQAAPDYFVNTIKKLAEFAKGIKALEKSSEVSELATDFEDNERDLLDFLEETKTTAMKRLKRTVNEIKVHLSTQKTEAKLNEDIYFSEHILAKTQEKCTAMLQNKIESLKEEVKMEAQQSAIATEGADKSKTLPKTVNIATQPKTVSEQEAIESIESVCKENIEFVEIESSEQTFGLEQSLDQTIQTQFEPITYVHGDIEATEKGEIDKHSEEIKNVATIEKTSSASKEIECNVSKAVKEDLEKLQTNVKKIFALAQAKTELPPEMNIILKKVESEVIEEIEETKNKWKTDS